MEPHPDSRFVTEPLTGREVYVETVGRDTENAGWVLLLHGLGDHVGRHGWIKEMLVKRGFGVLGIDWPGCGLSDGIRGDLPTLEEADLILKAAVEETGVSLTGAIAHSAGGFFLLRMLANRQEELNGLQWALFSSPLIRPDANHGKIKILAARALARIVPHLTISTHVRRDDCYHTAPDEEKKKLPPGCHGRVSFRFGAHLTSESGNELELAARIPPQLKTLIATGLSDHVCPPGFAVGLHRALPVSDRTLIAMGGARHEPFREPDRANYLSSIGLWLDRME